MGKKDINIDWPELDRELTIRERLDCASPNRQIEILQPLAKKYMCEKIGAYGIHEAIVALEQCKNGSGSRESFDFIIDQMVNAIERKQLEETLIPQATIAAKYKATQKEKAQKPRSIIPPLIARLIRRFPSDMTAKELWPHLFSFLDAEGYDPKEFTPNRRQPDTWSITYMTGSGEKKYKFSTFKTAISTIKKNKLA